MMNNSRKQTIISQVAVADFGYAFDIHIHQKHELVSDIIRERGRYSHNDLIIMRALIHEGDLVVDIGANIGWYTLFYAKFTDPSGLVLAIEPEQSNIAILRKNIAKNDIGNTKVFAGALSDARGRGQLFCSEENSGDHMLDAKTDVSSRDRVSVAIDTLDHTVMKYGRGRVPAFIKMDVQGSEPKVLRGARKLLESHRPTIVLEYSPRHMYACGVSGFEIFACIESYGYVPFRQLGDGEEMPGGKLLEILTPQSLFQYHERLMVSGFSIDILLIQEKRIPEIIPYIYNINA
jgi:FkbM family methyltransferase